jgi:carboxyvinyl-carboxyphosphonate phosphorylmutase
MSVVGLDETILRARAYAATGVDALFLVGVRTREQLDAVASAVNLPLMLGNAPSAIADMDYLSARKVRVSLQGHAPFMATIRAVYEALKSLREGRPPAEIQVASPDLVKRASRDDDYQRWLQEFLGAGTRRQ